MRFFSSPKSPIPTSQLSMATPIMPDALCDHHAMKPSLYVEEMIVFHRKKFNVLSSSSNVKRALTRPGRTNMINQQELKEQNSQLSDPY